MTSGNYLKQFIDGESIEAKDTNSNNQFLLDKISEGTSNLQATVSSQISNIKSDLETSRNNLETKLYTKLSDDDKAKIGCTINGVKIIGVNKIEQTEKEAREYIEQLVDIACYDFSRVTEIEIPEEGVYKLSIDSVNKHVYKSVFEGIDITGLDGRYTSGAQIITFTVENDEIVKIENELEINGRIVKNYNSYGMGVDFFSTTVFN